VEKRGGAKSKRTPHGGKGGNFLILLDKGGEGSWGV